MHHDELFSDNLLKRIPMASIVMAINIAMEHVPSEYVVGHLSFKVLHQWVSTGKGKDRLTVYRPTLRDEVERARKLWVLWDENRSKLPPAVFMKEDKKGKSKRTRKDHSDSSDVGKQPLYAYMVMRALLCAVNVALGEPTSELVDLLECLDDVPSVSGADLEKVESLTSVLQSLDNIFDSSHWKDIVNAA